MLDPPDRREVVINPRILTKDVEAKNEDLIARTTITSQRGPEDNIEEVGKGVTEVKGFRAPALKRKTDKEIKQRTEVRKKPSMHFYVHHHAMKEIELW